MATQVVSVSTGVMGSLLTKLSALLSAEYKLLQCIKGDIAFLSDELSSMDALLVKLASMEDKLDLQVKAWRNQVRELSYDIEDNIDLFMHKLCPVDATSSFVQKTTCKIRNLMMRRQIIKKIHQLKARVKEESDRRLRYNFDQYDAHVGIIEIDLRLPVLYVEATRLVGIDGPMEIVIDLLMTENNSAQPNVVSIVGFGGLGKTTLANQVYHKLKGQFDCTTFVPVSRNPHTKKILLDMLKEIGIRAIPDNERQIINILREYLQNRRYFVVIDDIWSTAAWEQLKSALPENSLCSKILTTTRNSDVARSCCFGFPRNIYEIQPLNEQDSKTLFFKRLFHSKIYCPPHLEQVSQAIIERCCGLPLAIISIASLLASKSNAKEQWDQVYNSIGYAFSSQGMRDILLLSYYDLPYHLKTCLLYLSIYPEDSRIKREELIRRWIAEGFITPVRGQTLEQIGDNYFNELVNRSMIQPINIKYDGRAEACRVHDMMLDLIISLSIEENFVNIIDGDGCNYYNSKIHRLSLQYSKVENEVAQNIIDNQLQVRSLNFFGPAKQIPYLSKFYSLRVLIIEDCICVDNQHIKNLGKFFQLKYLRIGCTSITKLPEDVADLQYLQTLDICRSKIERLPSSIGRLQRLIWLLVGCLVELPDEIGDLKALQVLSHANYYNSTKFVGGLKWLTNLKSLTIDLHDVDMLGNDGMGKYHKALELSLIELGKRGLESLKIGCFGYFGDKLMDLLCCTIPYLQKLVIDGDGITRLSRWLSSFVNLTHLDICILSICQEDLGLVGGMPVLLYLSMEVIQAPNDKLAISSPGFKCLKEFEFAYRWGGGLGLVCEPGSMPMLLRLQFELGAEETVSKMGFEFSFKNLSSLEHLTARINCLGATRSRVEAAEAAIRSAIAGHSGRPILEIQRKFEHSMEMDKEETRVSEGTSEEDLQPQPDLSWYRRTNMCEVFEVCSS